MKLADSFIGLTLIFLAGVVARFWNECVSCAFKKTVFSEQHTSFLAGLPHLHVFTLPAHRWVVAVAPILATAYNKTKNIVITLFITPKVRPYWKTL